MPLKSKYTLRFILVIFIILGFTISGILYFVYSTEKSVAANHLLLLFSPLILRVTMNFFPNKTD